MKVSTILSIALSLLTTTLAAPNCGKGIGTCPEGQCCSQYGYCGTTSDHCENTLGCQKEYGSCYASTSNGYCGETSAYCGTGCQSAYGLCGEEQMVEEEDVEWVTEWITETVYVYEEEVEDSRECGSDVMKDCPVGKCCSKYGYCGTSEAYCEISKGCQPAFGDCYEIVNTANIAGTNEKECGVGIGSCVNGECCNSDGFCGKDSEYCDIAKGCQENFGLCNSVSEHGECGYDFGRCPNPNHCCSRNGYCGTSEAYCNTSQGCQSDYGLCVNDIVDDYYEQDEEETSGIPIEPECGEGIGSCPNGWCCSKQGLCGIAADFCKLSNGCQSEFGECYSESSVGKCGEGYGRCPNNEQCCSKEGYCGTTEYYCLPDNGCQENYGKCDATVSNDFME
ncbi:hypothetical protein BCR36DRAFT_585026 [Piromyces finnis]|uniref:Chitin-binding type-1 domain-containing protein n=1 Tax=Piromyces finnis TaxID=1754191 RepID=A0A1Y1V4J3_9FUNG|nr:hypothetical protein BCR36DRAFT_585026 [Piromyces finnis]|eukprot:ORX46920.1 hypothetical protein BCR36DRAFT_585026 [Piromyces finnis]